MNKTPKAISVDWLQLHLHKTSDFNPDSSNIHGYNFVDVGYGSRVFQKLYQVIEPTGEILGIISMCPYSSVISDKIVILKLENRVLYQADYIARTFEFLSCCGLKYKGITRIDLAYDCNIFANGLLPENLINRYMQNKYLKIGLNRYQVNGNGTYKISSKNLKHPNNGDIQEHERSGVLWGSRKSDIQLNIYNKTKELNEVKMKPYIVDYWKLCGLDVDSNVWRVEIRIQANGKNLKEVKSGRLFSLSLDHLITQETIEQMFHDYAAKYCRFVKRDYHAKAQQMIELKLFSTDNEIILRPRRITGVQDSTRMHKIMINNIDKHIFENAKRENYMVASLEAIRDYYLKAYGLEKWHKEKEDREKYKIDEKRGRNEAKEAIDNDIEPGTTKFYRTYYAYLSDDIAARAAEARKAIEDEIKRIKNLHNESDEDYYSH